MEEIDDDLTPEKEYIGLSNTEKTINYAKALHNHGLSKRHAEVIAAKTTEPDVMNEGRAENTLAEVLDVDRETIYSHMSDSKKSVNDCGVVHRMVIGQPEMCIYHRSIGTNIEGVDQISINLNKRLDEDEELSSYTFHIDKMESIGWNDSQYKGTEVRHADTKEQVIDELKRIIKDYKSNLNPVPIVGEVMYALNMEEGLLDPNDEYNLRGELIDALCSPEGPPEDYDKAPTPFANFPSVISRWDGE